MSRHGVKKQKKSYVIPGLIKQIKNSKKKEITLKNLNHYRDFLSTKDISFFDISK